MLGEPVRVGVDTRVFEVGEYPCQIRGRLSFRADESTPSAPPAMQPSRVAGCDRDESGRLWKVGRRGFGRLTRLR